MITGLILFAKNMTPRFLRCSTQIFWQFYHFYFSWYFQKFFSKTSVISHGNTSLNDRLWAMFNDISTNTMSLLNGFHTASVGGRTVLAQDLPIAPLGRSWQCWFGPILWSKNITKIPSVLAPMFHKRKPMWTNWRHALPKQLILDEMATLLSWS
jgi:hypothetical protein